MKDFIHSEHPKLVNAMIQIAGTKILDHIVMLDTLRFDVRWPYASIRFEEMRILESAGYEVTVRARNKHSLWLRILHVSA